MTEPPTVTIALLDIFHPRARGKRILNSFIIEITVPADVVRRHNITDKAQLHLALLGHTPPS